ncbi:hypothetical protein C5167_025949 [Papaver somniferum]|uniref:Uncharacterized protein n=1 Tax=Papaver somniferum TaxID=3469 RepID=A0A4Y7JUE5_PAPSO|nr:hypothetical protein C5167_025949 [Papaver somniferum]
MFYDRSITLFFDRRSFPANENRARIKRFSPTKENHARIKFFDFCLIGGARIKCLRRSSLLESVFINLRHPSNLTPSEHTNKNTSQFVEGSCSDVEANQFADERERKKKEISKARSLAQQARRVREKQEKEEQERHKQQLPNSQFPQITSVIRKGALEPDQKKETSILRSLAQQARREKEKQEKKLREQHKQGLPNNQFPQIASVADSAVTQKYVLGPDQEMRGEKKKLQKYNLWHNKHVEQERNKKRNVGKWCRIGNLNKKKGCEGPHENVAPNRKIKHQW